MSEYNRRSDEYVDRASDEEVTSKKQLFPNYKKDSVVVDNYVSDTDESKEDMVEVEYEAAIIFVEPEVGEKGEESNIGVTSDGACPSPSPTVSFCVDTFALAFASAPIRSKMDECECLRHRV
ncbi:hypothetical protein ACFE04_027571 [Oxalis oulophora]